MESPRPRLAPTVQVGSFKLSGVAASVTLVGLLALVIAVLARYARPSATNWQMWVAGAIWLAFVVYWSAAAARAAPTKSSESLESRRVHTRLLNFSLLMLFVPVPGLGIRFLPASTSIAVAGLGVELAALALAVWARRHLGRNWSAAITVAVDHQLVRTGPYRVLRHPIYSAVLGLFYGTAIASGTVHALGGAVIMTFAYARKIRLEEQNLHNIFGAAYDDYRKTTWAIIPGLM